MDARERIVEWWLAEGRELPWRASRDPYAIWVSEVMSAQTQVSRAAPAWRTWMRRWPTVEALAGASLGEVLTQWQGLGYPRRARDLHRAARVVAADGWPPELTDLPGIGDYVAAAIRCFAWEQPVLPRDVNVRRVLERRFPDGVRIAADPWRSGQALMEFGQRVCAARPRCGECPVRAGCAVGEGHAEDPVRRARRQAPYRGSRREERGRLLARVLSGETVLAVPGADPAADGLVAEGLLGRAGNRLTAPG